MRRFLASIAGLALALAASSAGAQQPPDVVRLKNGAMYRGTISELVPNDHVDIVLVGGGTKRFSAAEIQYAGPEKAATQATPPPGGTPAVIVPAPHGARISFNAEGALTLHEVTGSQYGTVSGYRVAAVSEAHSFRTLCTAPCTVEMNPGTYEFALSEGDGRPVIAQRVVVPAGHNSMRGDYSSRAGVRTAGFVVSLVGVTTGLVLIFYPILSASEKCANGICSGRDIDYTMIWVGVGVTVVSAIVGSILASRPDIANVELIPGVVGWSSPPNLVALQRREGAWLASDSAAAQQGLSLRIRF
jgi:hypothetical protein